MRTTSRINAEYAAMPETVAIIGIDETREMRPAATGQYQPLKILAPGRLVTARSSRSFYAGSSCLSVWFWE